MMVMGSEAVHADGLNALQLQTALAAAARTGSSVSPATPIAGTTLGNVVSLAQGSVQLTGGDASGTQITVDPGTKDVVSVAHLMKDKLGEFFDPKDYGALGNGFVASANGTTPAGSVAITVNTDSRIAVGQLVGGVGIPINTRVASLATANGVTIVGLSSGVATTANIANSQNIGFFSTDDYPGFQAAEYAAWKAGGGMVSVGRGVYYLGTTMSNHGGVGLENRGGHIYGAQINGWGQTGTGLQRGAAVNLGMLSNAPYSESTIYAELDLSNSNSNTQKTVFSAVGNDNDNTNTALIDYYAKAQIVPGNNAGQIWAYQTQVQILPNSDGFATVLEAGIENSGSYQPSYGQPNAKLGFVDYCSGPNDCTAHEVVGTAGGHWHFGIYVQPGALRADGFAVALGSATAGIYLASLDAAGNLLIQNDQVKGWISQTVTGQLAASGTNQASSLVLPSHYDTVTGCNAGTGVQLPASTPVGASVVVLNRCGNPFTIYPPAGNPGAVIEAAAANAGVPIAAGANATFLLETTNQWRQIQ